MVIPLFYIIYTFLFFKISNNLSSVFKLKKKMGRIKKEKIVRLAGCRLFRFFIFKIFNNLWVLQFQKKLKGGDKGVEIRKEGAEIVIIIIKVWFVSSFPFSFFFFFSFTVG